MLSTAAFNALLKTLEEPPAHAIFVLATTEIHKIPATVLSRCQRHEFRRIPIDDIVMQLKRIVDSEKIDAEPEALAQIARQATGSFRDAISLLDQLASTGGTISLSLTQDVLGTAASQTVLDLLDAIEDRVPAAGMDAIHHALDSGTDPRLLARQVVDYLRAILFVQMGNESQVELPSETRQQVRRHAGAFKPADILRLVRLFNAAATDLRGSWQPSLSLELALAEALETPAAAPAGPSAPEKKSAAAPILEAPLPGKGPSAGAAGKSAAKPAAPAAGKDRGVPKEARKTTARPAAAKEPALPGSPAVNLDQIARAWKQVCAAIKPHNPSLNGLLNSCKLLEVKDGTLVLGFASELLRSKADTPEQMEITRKALLEVAGLDLPLRCVLSSARQSTPSDVKQDGMVAAALKAGGEIVDIQE
jgi:DNA polymerase-3 subunit gamma/tau